MPDSPFGWKIEDDISFCYVYFSFSLCYNGITKTFLNTIQEAFMSIGSNITKYRKEKGFTQAELGEKLGVSNQAVSKWESDSTLPDVMLLPDLAGVLGVSIYDLYGLSEPTGCPSPSFEPEDRRILKIHVITEGVDLVTRVPVSAIRAAFYHAMIQDALARAGIDPTESEGLLGMLDSGKTGTLVNVDTDECQVTIVVENYEN